MKPAPPLAALSVIPAFAAPLGALPPLVMHANTRPSRIAPTRRPVGLLVAGLFLVAPLGSLLAQTALAAPTTPRAALRPAPPQAIPSPIPPLPLRVNAPPSAPQLRVAAPKALPKATAKTEIAGGGKLIKIAQTGAVANLGAKKKVIQVPALSLPPLSTPLPTWMQAASVRVDKLEKPSNSRLAQNAGAPPVRNPAGPVTNSDRLPNQIEVATSTYVVLLTTTDLQTVAVADPSIADVAVVNSRAVLLNGKGSGVTSLVIVDGQKIRQYSVRVTAAPNQRPTDIAEQIGIPGVTVRMVMGAVVLSGEVGSEIESKRAAEIAGIYAPKVINQLSVRPDETNSSMGRAMQISDLIGLPGVTVRMAGETAILSGNVESESQVRDAETVAATMAPKVLNLLKTPPVTVDQLRQSLGLAPLNMANAQMVPGAGLGGVGAAPAPIAGAGVPEIGTLSPLTIREAAGQLILEGTLESESEVQRALAEAARTGLPVSNRLRVRPAPTAGQTLALAVAGAINLPGVRVSGSANRLILQGVVQDTNDAVVAEQIARSFAPQVDNLLQTPNPVLVDVDISIVEISNNDLKNLGFQFPSLQDSSGSGFVIGQVSQNDDLPGALQPTGSTTAAQTPATPTTPGGTPTAGTPVFVRDGGLFRSFRQQTAFQASLRAEVRENKIRLLSNPRTTVLSGRTATFQVGGQVPIPTNITQTATGTVTSVQFKDFGVLVDVVPNALPNGNVTLRLRTEVSQPDNSIGFQPIAGAGIIPGFTRRATVSEVTVPRDGTVALGGLISSDNRKLISRVPILSNIPILGALFKSKRFQDSQTELVIFVTPRVLPNTLSPGTLAPAGVVAAGNTINAGTVLGNPGIAQFNVGGAIATGGGTPQ